VLKQSDEGLLVLTAYKKENKLNNDLRNKLAKVIVSSELSPDINYTINSSRAAFLSEQIKKVFPTGKRLVLFLHYI